MEIQDIRERAKRFHQLLGTVRIGLPKRVEFVYRQGIVVCYPKEKRWVVTLSDKKPVEKIYGQEVRNDVTKYRARMLLKLTILGILKAKKSA